MTLTATSSKLNRSEEKKAVDYGIIRTALTKKVPLELDYREPSEPHLGGETFQCWVASTIEFVPRTNPGLQLEFEQLAKCI